LRPAALNQQKQQQSRKWSYRILHGDFQRKFLEAIENGVKEAVQTYRE
jgi:hypothetical protein